MVEKKILVGKKILLENILGWKKFLVRNILWSEKIFGRKKFLARKNFWQEKNFGQKKILVGKHFWFEIFFAPSSHSEDQEHQATEGSFQGEAVLSPGGEFVPVQVILYFAQHTGAGGGGQEEEEQVRGRLGHSSHLWNSL